MTDKEPIKDAAMRDRIEHAAKENAVADKAKENVVKEHLLADKIKENKAKEHLVSDKIEDKTKERLVASPLRLTVNQQIVLDGVMGKQVQIMALFKQNGMDSMDQLHAWRDLLIIFNPPV